jgi:membrane glycosyltransferase
MNNTSEYIDAMPLTDIEKAALPKSDIRAVHTALDGEHRQFSRDDDTPLGSVKARLEQAWPDSLAEGQLIKDDEGRDQLQAMPKATFLYVPRSVAHQPGGPLLGSPARA